VKLFWQV